jgi:hypothetical protein
MDSWILDFVDVMIKELLGIQHRVSSIQHQPVKCTHLSIPTMPADKILCINAISGKDDVLSETLQPDVVQCFLDGRILMQRNHVLVCDGHDWLMQIGMFCHLKLTLLARRF